MAISKIVTPGEPVLHFSLAGRESFCGFPDNPGAIFPLRVENKLALFDFR
jgi:hypothetical protein